MPLFYYINNQWLFASEKFGEIVLSFFTSAKLSFTSDMQSTIRASCIWALTISHILDLKLPIRLHYRYMWCQCAFYSSFYQFQRTLAHRFPPILSSFIPRLHVTTLNNTHIYADYCTLFSSKQSLNLHHQFINSTPNVKDTKTSKSCSNRDLPVLSQ